MTKTAQVTAGQRKKAPSSPTGREIQAFNAVTHVPIALGENVQRDSTTNLNQLLADIIAVRDLYQKHHWQASGPTFYPLHLLFEKHLGEQGELADQVAERIMALGGVCVAMPADVAAITLIPPPPRGREPADV